MNKHLLSFLVPFLFFYASSAFAEDSNNKAKPYVGAFIGSLALEEDGFDGYEPDFVILMGRLGARFNEYFDGEIRFGRGLIEDSTTINGVNFDTELDYIAGAYIKVGAGESFHPYAMLGYSKASISITGSNGVSSVSASDAESDVAFGLGLDIFTSDKVAINAECASYYDKDDVTLNGCAVGLLFTLN